MIKEMAKKRLWLVRRLAETGEEVNNIGNDEKENK